LTVAKERCGAGTNGGEEMAFLRNEAKSSPRQREKGSDFKEQWEVTGRFGTKDMVFHWFEVSLRPVRVMEGKEV
jgi:hypothetical protein